jgi:hypothetical protein
MFKNKLFFSLLFTFCALNSMEQSFTGTPAQQTAAQFKAQINHEFKPELMEILKENHPFNLLYKLKNFYNKNRSVFPSMHEMCASFMLTLKYSRAALGSKISDLAPSEAEHAWQKEWTLACIQGNLHTSQATVKSLAQKIEQQKKKFARVPVDEQAFYPCEDDLKKKAPLVTRAKKIVAAHDQLQSLQEKPLILFKDNEFKRIYNESLRELYSPQTIDADAQEMHADGHSLLFQLCHQNLSVSEFSQMLGFLTSGYQGLRINQKINEQTLLDYAKKIKLDQEYITTIVNFGGKKNQKSLRWSNDVQDKNENNNTLL